MEVIAIFDYDAQAEDELTLKVNDVIKDVTVGEGGWWTGVLNGKRGFFPDNFVKDPRNLDKSSSLSLLKSAKQNVAVAAGDEFMPCKAKVLYSYSAANDDELSLTVGDIIEVLSEEEEGWWKGIVDGQTGLFPSNFVQVLGNDDSRVQSDVSRDVDQAGTHRQNSSSAVIPTSRISSLDANNQVSRVSPAVSSKARQTESFLRDKKQRPVHARVVFSYAAANDDELTLNVGETITVLEKKLEDIGWWRGELNGKIGVFPDNFVELLSNENSTSESVESVANGVGIGKNRVERPPPPNPSKLAALRSSVKETVTKQFTGIKRLTNGTNGKAHADSKLIALTDDHKAGAVEPPAVSADQKPMNNGSNVSAFVRSSATAKQQVTRATRPPPPSKLNSFDQTKNPPLPPKSPGLRDASLLMSRTNYSPKLDKYRELPVPEHEDLATQLRHEIDVLRQTIHQSRFQSDKKFQMLKAELEEERCARKVLQGEFEQLKNFVAAQFGYE